MPISHRTQQARIAILRVLQAADLPVADRTLRDLARQHLADSWNENDLGDVIRDMELERYIEFTTRQFDQQKVWQLTDKGRITANGIHG